MLPGKKAMKALQLILLPVVYAFTAVAQYAPIIELGGHYQMLRVNSRSKIPAFTANGGTGTSLIKLPAYLKSEFSTTATTPSS